MAFIFHATRAWLKPTPSPFEKQILPYIKESKSASKLVESIVVTHFRRHYPTYYIKAESEIDVAYVDKNKFWPVEVKWRNQLRAPDLKQIQKYQNGVVWAKVEKPHKIENLAILPLVEAILTL